MQFIIPKLTNYGDNGSTSITDRDGNSVGALISGKGDGRHVNLLGKYKGHFQTIPECEAFAKGVAAVLNHMMRDDM
jgi:hypothetical protein